jgi:DNA polymerase
LRIILPSGRALCYPSPRVDPKTREITYKGPNIYSRKWTTLKTYGGKLAENVTQASSRDVFYHNMPAIEDAGYGIILRVHDELVTEVDDTEHFTVTSLAGIMSCTNEWSQGLPLAAAGFETYRYRKG